MARKNTPTLIENRACLLVQGPDSPGIVAIISELVRRHDGNIIGLDQFSEQGPIPHFFQRVEFDVEGLADSYAEIELDLAETLTPFRLKWRLADRSKPKRMVVLASKSDHCLVELLWRHSRGELPVEIPLVISNHREIEETATGFGVPFAFVSSLGPDKSMAEAEILRLVDGKADFLVLARYMQIISNDFLRRVGMPIINIHHSFLPAFIGASPYRKAKERGVKMIGATAHYVTEELDEGPIIEQDIARVSHSHTAAGLQERGQYVERAVLSRAVQWHAEDRVILEGNHTIVFA